MDLILACIVLTLTNISFALLANHWRVQAKRQAATSIRLALKLNRARGTGYRDGWNDSERLAIGRMYKAAVLADHAGTDILAALRLAAPGVESDVQPLAVGDETGLIEVPEAT